MGGYEDFRKLEYSNLRRCENRTAVERTLIHELGGRLEFISRYLTSVRSSRDRSTKAANSRW